MAHSVASSDISKQLKKTFTKSDIVIDNIIFTLHHNVTFVLILVGLLFATGNNYFNKGGITCSGGDAYDSSYCFLHGGGHILSALQGEISSQDKCTIKSDGSSEDERHTSYYVWLPSVLCILAVMTKVPRFLWRNIIEGSFTAKHVKDIDTDSKNDNKVAKRFFRVIVKKSWKAVHYNFGYAVCEILNIAMLVASVATLDSLFHGMFIGYGRDVRMYYEDRLAHNPMCNLFPTEVSCTVRKGAVTGGANQDNMICLLQLNIVNQFFFLILWWWYLFLFTISMVGLVYRIAQLSLPQVGK